MDRSAAPLLLLIAGVLVGCTSAQPLDVPPHSQLKTGELLEVSASGETEVDREIPDGAERAVVLADGIAVEVGGAILRTQGSNLLELGSGILLAADRHGRRFASFSNGDLTVHGGGGLLDIAINCDQVLAGAWDGSNTVIAVLCSEELHVIGPDSGEVFSRSLPGIGVDITNWGEGFGVLVRSGDALELYRTPCHEQDVFGLLYEVDIQDIVQVVAGIEKEGWLALQEDGTLLNFTGDDFEVVGNEVIDIGEVPGVELEFKCQLGAIESN